MHGPRTHMVVEMVYQQIPCGDFCIVKKYPWQKWGVWKPIDPDNATSSWMYNKKYGEYWRKANAERAASFLTTVGESTYTNIIGDHIKSDIIPEVGEIIGWRVWRFKYARLYSVYMPYEWPIDSPACGDPTRFDEGIHAFNSKILALNYAHKLNFRDRNINTIVLGSVRLFGLVEEHSIGYRAEYARIHEIHRVTGIWPRIKLISRLYNVPDYNYTRT
jgi:hypothetical protein